MCSRCRLASLLLLVALRPSWADIVNSSSGDDVPNRELMINFGDIEYVTFMRVGHQTINAILDTGSFEVVVFSMECKTCGQASRYSPALSTTHKTGQFMTLHSYGSGDTYSLEASDMVSIGSFPEKSLTFWEVVDAHMSILKNAEFNAIVGVGPPETPAADAWSAAQKALDDVNRYFLEGKKPPRDVTVNARDSFDSALETSRSQTLLDTFQVSTFSVCMGAKPGADGYFVWKDTSHVSQPDLFTRVPILGLHTWSVSLRNVRMQRPGTFIEKQLGCTDDVGCSVLIDSGTSLIAVPKDVLAKVRELMSQMNADCNKLHELPDLVFEMGGGFFTLPPDAYLAEVKGNVPDNLVSLMHLRNTTTAREQNDLDESANCKVLLMESYMDSNDGPVWVFGMPFFRKYYTTFEVGSNRKQRALHIAEADDDCTPAKRSSLARTRMYKRKIDVRRVHAPPLLKNFSGKVQL